MYSLSIWNACICQWLSAALPYSWGTHKRQIKPKSQTKITDFTAHTNMRFSHWFSWGSLHQLDAGGKSSVLQIWGVYAVDVLLLNTCTRRFLRTPAGCRRTLQPVETPLVRPIKNVSEKHRRSVWMTVPALISSWVKACAAPAAVRVFQRVCLL